MSPRARYFIQFAIFLAVVAAGVFAWNLLAPPAYTHRLSWAIFAFFIVAYTAGHLFLLGAEGQRPAVFVRRFMAITTLRLLFFLLVLVIYSFTHKPEAVVFICHFLAGYILFTTFEVASLSRNFRKKADA